MEHCMPVITSEYRGRDNVRYERERRNRSRSCVHTGQTHRHTRRARSFRFQKLVLFLIFTLLISFLCGITFGSILSNAKGSEEKALDTFKYYKSITIESGDSLWSIASENMSGEYDSIHDYIDEICFINSLNSKQIHAGSSLVIPYYAAEFK